MKKLFTALLLLVGLNSFSQSIGYFRYDSIRFEKIGGNAELILLNGTRNVTGGVLTNLGNGRTGFVTPSGGSGGLSGGNLGSGFRLYYPPSQGVKTLFAGYGQVLDSVSNANGITVRPDTATLFSALRTTIPAGYNPLNILGTLYTNNTWNSTIRGTDITEAGGVTVADSSGFLILKNGGDNFTQTANIKRSPTLGINPYFTNLEYWSFYIRFYVRQTGAIGVGITSTAANNLTADAIGYFNSINGSSNFIANSASNLSSSIGDQIEMKVERDGFKTLISVRNITTNSAWITTVGAYSLPTSNTPHTTGQFAIFSYSGWYAVDSVGIHSKAPTYPDLAVIGTSKTEGKNGTPQTRYITKLQTRFTVVEHAGIAETTEEWISNYWELLAMHPKQVILENPCNDLRFLVNVDSTKARMYRIERAFRDQGASVYHLDAIYETSSSSSAWRTHLYTTRSPDSIIYVYTPTSASGALDVDNIHPTEVGQDIIYQTIVQSGKIKLGIAPESGNQDAILNQSGTSQVADFDITGTGRIRGYFRVGPQASGITTMDITTASNNNIKLYNAGGINNISSLVDNNATFTQMQMQATTLSFYTSGVQALTMNTLGNATFANSVAVGCTGCSGTLPFTITGATNQVISSGYNGTYLQQIAGNAGATQGRKIRHLASEYDFSVYTSAGVVIPAIEISTTGATTINQSGIAINTIIKGDNDANLITVDGTNDRVGIGVASPTSWLHLKAGTSSVAQLKLNASTLLGTTQAGAIEYDGTHLYFTAANAGTRFQLDQQSAGMTNPMTTTGDIIYSSSGSTPARLGIGTNGDFLKVVSGVPAWASLSSTVSSGSFTPTLTNTTNVASSTGARGFYTRSINVVDVTITVQVTPTASATVTTFSVDIPIASNFTTGVEGAGTSTPDGADCAHLNIDTTNDKFTASFTSTGTTGVWVTLHFKYTVQ